VTRASRSAGGEIRVGTPLIASELEILAHGPPGRRWLLLEAPLDRGRLADLHAHADELQARGYGLLIAHPERCPDLAEPGGGLAARLGAGARLQVNASSVTGVHGDAARDTALRLLHEGAVAVLASDAHGVDRPPLLGEAVRRLAEHGIDGTPLVASRPRALLAEGIAPTLTRSVVHPPM
jgi:protein-tyrosine phosphatase